MSFVHLHRHSDFSLLDGCGSNERYAKRAAEMGQEALAITDHGSMAGVLYHIKACTEAGIKPIVGIEAYFKPDPSLREKGYSHLVLLAKNFEGWLNLLRLSALSAREDHFYYKPRIGWDDLEKHSEGLIASSSCVSGELPKMILEGQGDKGPDQYVDRMLSLFGDDFYLEIQPHDFPEQREVNSYLSSFAVHHNLPLVATIDAHYPYEDWDVTQDILLMISTNSSLQKRKDAAARDEDYMSFSGHTFWLMTEQEAKDSFDTYHSGLGDDVVAEAIANTKLFADRVEHFEISKAAKMPRATKSILEAERVLRQWCEEGLVRIGKLDDMEYRDRMEKELAMMRKQKAMDYFVIVGKMVRYMKDNGCRIGPCRGSAGGSLVCYLSRITALDPIGYGLLFERFMNEYRTEMPDVDLDFQHNRRDEAKAFLKREFGEDHVVDVGAFGTFASKAAIQCVARTQDIPFEEFMGATKEIVEHPANPREIMEHINDARNTGSRLDKFATNHPDVIEHAVRLEGQFRNMSKHPAAVIVTDKPASEYIPLMKGNKGEFLTQWVERPDFQVISGYGFLKIDVLSTDALTIQQTALDLIEKRKGIRYDFEDPNQFPVITDPNLADPEVVKAFRKGPYTGIFQFHSYGMTQLLKDVQPDKLDDLIACNSMFRPGTLTAGITDEYVSRKQGHSHPTPWHDDAAPFMESTNWLMIYQEQVMQVCQVMGGFDAGTSSLVLKALTKWHGSRGQVVTGADRIAKYEEQFVAGCVSKGLSRTAGVHIWKDILSLTKYVFNRSHSAGYALQAYFDRWLMMYHPLEFYAALLTWEPDKVSAVIRDVRHSGIKVLPPDVNVSSDTFVLDGNSIRFNLSAIKGVGAKAVEEILAQRPFTSVQDFRDKCAKRTCNARVLNGLLQAGAFDSLGERSDWSLADKSKAEKELMGLTLSRESDVERYRKIMDEFSTDPAELLVTPDGDDVYVSGEISDKKEVTDRNGGRMAFLKIEFGDRSHDVVVFSRLYSKVEHRLEEGTAVVVMGKWQEDKESVNADVIATPSEIAHERKVNKVA